MKQNRIFNIDVEQIQRLEEHSQKTNLSKSRIVRDALDSYFNNSQTREDQVQRISNAVVDRLFGASNGK